MVHDEWSPVAWGSQPANDVGLKTLGPTYAAAEPKASFRRWSQPVGFSSSRLPERGSMGALIAAKHAPREIDAVITRALASLVAVMGAHAQWRVRRRSAARRARTLSIAMMQQ